MTADESDVVVDISTSAQQQAQEAGADVHSEGDGVVTDSDEEDIEATGAKPNAYQQLREKKEGKPPVNPRSSYLVVILTFFSFEWVTPWVLKWIFVRPTLKDIWGMQSKSDSRNVGDHFEKVFRREQKKGGNALMRTLLIMYGYKFILSFVTIEARDLMSFAMPIFLRQFMLAIGDRSVPDVQGYIWGLLLFLSQLIFSLLQNQYMQITFVEIGIQMKAALTTGLYRKSLRLSAKARARRPAGEVQNLMSSDCEKPVQLIPFLMFGFSCLIMLVVNMAYLFWFLNGGPAVASLVVLALLTPFQFFVMTGFGKFIMATKKFADKRMAAMNEVLNGMRIIKFFTWENQFEKKVKGIRNREIREHFGLAALRAVLTTIIGLVPVAISVACFATIVIANGPDALTAQAVFPALLAINQLRIPLALIPIIMSTWVDWLLTIKRMNSFLMEEEDESIPEIAPEETPVVIRNGEFIWELPPVVKPTGLRAVLQKRKEKKAAAKAKKEAEAKAALQGPPAEVAIELDEAPAPLPALVDNKKKDNKAGGKLLDIDLEIKKGTLTIIVGPVGSGKSSLLNAIIGDMRKEHGSILLHGRLAYCAQQAWIKNDTVRGNILFGQRFDQQKYATVVKVCALERDLEIFQAGDQTEIGEKGVTMSGGQKQRIALARSVYNDADVYLLDDVLSAVDAHVGKYLFNECIGKHLASKTRVLVTHQIQYLQYADHIIVMNEGRIEQSGSYAELMAVENGMLARMVREFTTQESEEDKAKDEHASKKKKKKKSKSSAASADSKAQEANSSQQQLQPYKSSFLQRLKSLRKKQDNKQAAEVGKTMSQEEKTKGIISPITIFVWLNKFGGPLVYIPLAAIYVLSVGASTLTDWFLSQWVSKAYPQLQWGSYLGIYLGLGAITAVLTLLREFIFQFSMLLSSKRMHDSMLRRIMRAPMSFFDTTPLGRILSRFSGDLQLVDMNLAFTTGAVLSMFFQIIATFVLIAVAFVWFLIALAILIPVYFIISQMALASTRELKRVEATARSPVYALLSESMSGFSTIRAYGRIGDFMRMNEKLLNNNLRAFFALDQVSRWMTVRLEIIGTLVVLIAAMLAVGLRNDPNVATSAALPLTYALSITNLLTQLMRNAIDTEMGFNSVDRILHYSRKVPQEKALTIKKTRPAKEWPQQGEIVFQNVCARYRPELPQVLKNVSFTINPNEKIGVVGRTGSGKSTTMQLLYRIMELESGSISIDGIDISTLGLHELRGQALSIIPQEAVLFTGTVRSNLDPFKECTDRQLWDSLEKAHMRPAIEALPKKLDAPVHEGGSNFSVGQRQLLCLARAICKNSKIIIMDEASANLDFEADALIQKTVRESFASSTRLTIAHRLNTIIDSDRVLVLEMGEVAEFDTPANLLRDPEGIFTSLVNETGNANATLLKQIAFGLLSVDELYKQEHKHDAEEQENKVAEELAQKHAFVQATLGKSVDSLAEPRPDMDDGYM